MESLLLGAGSFYFNSCKYLMNNYALVTLISSDHLFPDHFFPFLLNVSQSLWVGRALGECYLGGRKILLESQAHYFNGHISVYAYPFSARLCSLLLRPLKIAMSANIQNYSICLFIFTLYPTLINYSP